MINYLLAKNNLKRFILYPYTRVLMWQLFLDSVFLYFALMNAITGVTFISLLGLPFLLLFNYGMYKFQVFRLNKLQEKMLPNVSDASDPKEFSNYKSPEYRELENIIKGRRKPSKK